MEENTILEEILNGSFVFRRFTRKEQGGSSDAADRFLWLALLRAELEYSGTERSGICEGADGTSGTSFSPCRFLTTLSEPLPDIFGDLADSTGRFRDRGQESVVFDGGDGFVYKLRKMRPSILSGVHLKFYSSDYYVSDFQPGRNTIIDAETGAVRFIDPRVALNDPDGPLTPVSRIGRRHERVPPMLFP